MNEAPLRQRRPATRADAIHGHGGESENGAGQDGIAGLSIGRGRGGGGGVAHRAGWSKLWACRKGVFGSRGDAKARRGFAQRQIGPDI